MEEKNLEKLMIKGFFRLFKFQGIIDVKGT